uniref:Uncharacterized protein n=1 Tax=Pyxicephalus adspersus TaxID=30357 RepID=A0AAV3B823_PYXAD|nr:TPA: hypothetical protein GDO54_007711 [Pyxicephalus adspersus]
MEIRYTMKERPPHLVFLYITFGRIVEYARHLLGSLAIYHLSVLFKPKISFRGARFPHRPFYVHRQFYCASISHHLTIVHDVQHKVCIIIKYFNFLGITRIVLFSGHFQKTT